MWLAMVPVGWVAADVLAESPPSGTTTTAKGQAVDIEATSIILREGAVAGSILSAVDNGDFVRPIVNIVISNIESATTVRTRLFIDEEPYCDDEITISGNNLVFEADCGRPLSVQGSELRFRAEVDFDDAIVESDESNNRSARTYRIGDDVSLDLVADNVELIDFEGNVVENPTPRQSVRIRFTYSVNQDPSFYRSFEMKLNSQALCRFVGSRPTSGGSSTTTCGNAFSVPDGVFAISGIMDEDFDQAESDERNNEAVRVFPPGSAPTASTDYDDATARVFEAPERGDGRLARVATLLGADSLAIDSQGNVFLSDQADHRIRRIDARSGVIETIIGDGSAGFTGEGIAGEASRTNLPGALAVDAAGNLYYADVFNSRIRRWDAATGVVDTVAGNGAAVAFALSGQPAVEAAIGTPTAIALSDDTLFITNGQGAGFTVDLPTGVLNVTNDASNPGSSFNVSAVAGDGRLLAVSRFALFDVTTEPPVELVDGVGSAVAIGGMIVYFVRGESIFRFDLDDPESLEEFCCASRTNDVEALAVGPGGELFFATVNERDLQGRAVSSSIFKLSPDVESGATAATRAIVDVAGTAPTRECALDLEAAPAESPEHVALGPDGIVYVVDGVSGDLIAIDRSNGEVDVVASFSSVSTLEIDRDSNLYIREGRTLHTARRGEGIVSELQLRSNAIDVVISPGGNSGLVRRSTGSGTSQLCEFQLPAGATTACVVLPEQSAGIGEIATGAGGFDFFFSSGNQILGGRFAEDPEFEVIAGTGVFAAFGESNPLRLTEIDSAERLKTGLDGRLYTATATRILRIDLQEDRLVRVLGTPLGVPGARLGQELFRSDRASINPADFAVDTSGNIVFLQFGELSIGIVERVGGTLLIPPTAGEGDELGRAVAADGAFVAVGAPGSAGTGSGEGSVTIFRNDGCRLITEARLSAPTGFDPLGFGSAVALSGNLLAVGSVPEQTAKGSQSDLQVAIFERANRDWRFKEAVASPDADARGFGGSVALNGQSLAIGAPATDEGAGRAYVFSFDGASFSAGREVPAEAALPGGFGTAVALGRDKLAVSAPGSAVGNAIAGSVALYDLLGENLDLISTVEAPSDQDLGFGSAVSLAGNRMVVGAPDATAAQGRTYLFDFDAREIRIVSELVASELNESARFGEAVAIGDELAFVGAPGLRTTSDGTGGVFAFDLPFEPDGRKGAQTELVKINPSFYQSGLGAAVATAEGRGFFGAPGTGKNRGDAVASEVIANLGGVAGLWFDPSLDGEGYNVIPSESGMVVFYFGSDSNGDRLWLVSETLADPIQFDSPTQLDLFDATRGDFDTPVPSSESLKRWGTLRLTLNSNAAGTFELNGVDGRKVSTANRLLSVNGARGGLGGLWFDPAADGEGYNVVTAEAGTVIFYYGRSRSGEPLWLVSDTIVEQNSLGAAPLSIPVFQASTGSFDTPSPSSDLVPWGQLTVTFSACDRGEFSLDGNDGEKVSRSVQLAAVVARRCEAQPRGRRASDLALT
ncbi:MAG: hypothetical protein AAGE01_10775 [Pseudomonadota bacterium]